MKSLVISKSKVLLQFFKIVLKDKGEYVTSAKEAKDKEYNIIFIDDIMNVKSELSYIKENNLKYEYLILVGEGGESEFDLTLKKPFLPKDLEELIENLEITQDIDIIESIEDLATNLTTSNSPIKTNVLDPLEVAKIKELMETQIETDFVSILKNRKKIKAKNKEAKNILKELCKMDKKERKKLLKNCKISLKIELKEKE
ncbi:MAG: hypothetical protein GXN91_00790 [Epsilonproteobacteria bacterium]|nr:hypothetical protein [Campylobacterota bacterium]